ncbi:MAG: AraC family transcriptional regulator N-terminal domain-containing protein [Maritimibacter sp.]
MDLSRLTDLCTRYHAAKQAGSPGLPQFSVLRREAESDIEATIYEPVMCLILQGSKVTSIGDQTVELTPGDTLLVSHDLPVTSRITKASPDEPYLAAILSLDLGLLRSLYDQLADAPVSGAPLRSLSAGPVEPAWLPALSRYVELMGDPRDAKVLGPATLREIHYRLLLSHLRGGFRAPLSVPDLARIAGMSPSSFHEHFKAVTGTTPLQYQKDLRLIDARALLVDHRHSVSQAAYEVGYESPTHFSRDYSRKFGVPPSQHLRSTGPAGSGTEELHA